MKKTTTLKALALSMIMTLGLALPMMAQTDNFFKSNNEDIYENRDGGIPEPNTYGGITNGQFGAPLGSGLLILAAAGAGYAVARRRRSMRKAGTMLLALAMVLTFTQCKKRIETITPDNGGSTRITLKVENNAKYQVDTNGLPWSQQGTLGSVEWEDDDFILVLSNCECVGILYYDENEGCFSGVLGENNQVGANATPATGQPLYFCFTGNTFPDDEGTMDISNQEDNLMVLSIGASRETYPSANNTYNCLLDNKCALVKFTMDEDETNSSEVRVSNMVTKAQFAIKLKPGTEDEYYPDIVPVEESTGFILLNNPGDGVSNVRWAVLLPQDEVEHADFVIGNRFFRYSTGETGGATVGKTSANGLVLDATISKTNTTLAQIQPYFSVSDDKVVYISPGNLQYKVAGDTAGQYRFAKHQWDFVGGTNSDVHYGNVYTKVDDDDVICDNNQLSDTDYKGWIDLFGWGTGDAPTKYATSEPYPWTEWGNYLNLDGTYNSAGNSAVWYTLTRDEWDYLIKSKGVRKYRTSPATVNGVRGMVLLPDVFEMPSGCTFNFPELEHPEIGYEDIFNQMHKYNTNVYNADKWTAMETAGAVFMPSGGLRGYDNVNEVCTFTFDATGSTPYYCRAYWTSTNTSNGKANALEAKNSLFFSDSDRFGGKSVRLVRDAVKPF